MTRWTVFGAALLGGVLATLATGLVPTRSALGATHYGLPVPWLVRRALAPEYLPWEVLWTGLLVDLGTWSALVLLALVLYRRFLEESGELT